MRTGEEAVMEVDGEHEAEWMEGIRRGVEGVRVSTGDAARLTAKPLPLAPELAGPPCSIVLEAAVPT